MAVATEGLEKLEDMIVRQAEATGAQVAAAEAAIGSAPAASSSLPDHRRLRLIDDLNARDPEPDRAGRHIPPSHGLARPLPTADRRAAAG
jgi:hypothetical protein